MARIGNFYWASLFLTGFLAGCGGGGGGGNAWTPIASTEVFQLKTAWDNIVRDTGTRSFTVSGTYAGLALRGSGSITQGGLVGAVFEGVAAQLARRGPTDRRTWGYLRAEVLAATLQAPIVHALRGRGEVAAGGGPPEGFELLDRGCGHGLVIGKKRTSAF